jgi:hypothetical protein
MRFIITASAGDTPPATDGHLRPDAPFDTDMFVRYMKFNEELYQAGVLVASEGLNPGAKSARVGVAGGERRVLDGPFTETKELVGGFYIIEVASLEEAISWAMRCPTGLGTDNLLEIRPLTEMTDIPPELLALSQKVAPAWTTSVTTPRKR